MHHIFQHCAHINNIYERNTDHTDHNPAVAVTYKHLFIAPWLCAPSNVGLAMLNKTLIYFYLSTLTFAN